jgi:mono/diheme cytochrome c family protein
MRLTLALVLISLCALPAVAQEADPEVGKAVFQQNCATCHGVEARGDGPMADILSIAPPDLTQIAGEDGFPSADVVRRIDGRDMLLAHGGPMPIFGYILEERSAVIEDEDGTPVFTSQAVLDIAAYLESLQR